MKNTTESPPRTIGIILAISLATILYTLIPLVIVIFTIALKARMQDTMLTVGADGTRFVGGGLGFTSITVLELVLWASGALGFLLIAIRAWRGPPSKIRYRFIASVVIMPLWYGGLWAYRTYQDNIYLQETGALSATPSVTSLCQGSILLPVVAVTLYIVWYMNRGPARAFFRGHYLDPRNEKRSENPPS